MFILAYKLLQFCVRNKILDIENVFNIICYVCGFYFDKFSIWILFNLNDNLFYIIDELFNSQTLVINTIILAFKRVYKNIL